MLEVRSRSAALVAAVATVAAVGVTAQSFLRPIPRTTAAAPSQPPRALPSSRPHLGAESSELHQLAIAEETGPACALFPDGPSGVRVAPDGVRRADLDAEDPGVAPYLGDLAGDGKSERAFRVALVRSGRYDLDVPRILRAWQVPEELVAVAFVASACDNGNRGLWALTEDVAKAYGLVVGPSYDERRSVALSTEVFAHYLADLRERFGSWELAVAAFGIGYAGASRAIGEVPPRDAQALPSPAGLAYLRSVSAVATALANRAALGLEGVSRESPVLASDLEVPAGTPFALAARAAGVPLADLLALNPEYRGDVVPNVAPSMILHVPAAALARAKEMLIPLLYSTSGHATASAPLRTASASRRQPASPSHFYRAQQDEPLADLARRLGADLSTLASENALDPTARVHAGQWLTLSRSSTDASP